MLNSTINFKFIIICLLLFGCGSSGTYEGAYLRGKLHGYGTYKWPDGEKYIGDWAYGKRNGYGTNFWPDGDKYIGQFINNKKDGKGTYYWNEGNKYVGMWKNDKRSGLGVFTYKSGKVTEGYWRNDKYQYYTKVIKDRKTNDKKYQDRQEKFVKNINDNSESLKSYFKKNKANTKIKSKLPPCSSRGGYRHMCFGTFTSKTYRYTGEFQYNKMHGKGEYVHIANDKFKGYYHSGQYRNGIRQGFGRAKWSNGDQYSGQYSNGKSNGYGVFVYADGDKYEGEFKDDKREGEGIYFLKTGKKIEGVWKNGVFQYTKKVIRNKTLIADLNNSRVSSDGLYETKQEKVDEKYISSLSNYNLCNNYKLYKNYDGSFSSKMSFGQIIKQEAKRRGLDCIKNENKAITTSKPKSAISSVELELERQKRKKLERKLALILEKQKKEQNKIETDIRAPILEIISNKTRGKRGTIYGIAKDNIEVAEVSIDGKEVNVKPNGNFQYSTYVPPSGVKLKIEVTDVAGLTTSKIVELKGNLQLTSSSISFDRLNPLSNRVKFNPNALALIVGVSNYENTNAKALYADNDALVFKDYAVEKLGISANKIKLLLNDSADEKGILLSVKDWLRRSAKPNQSDVYIFFAGHGLASDDGKNMYLLPHDGSPRLLEKTAILRDELFNDIKQANPRSVTVFLDTCYSGTTRGTDMLIASRPIAIRALEQSIPDNFTVFSAAAGDQTSNPLEEAKHGMFSYFLMKGMEGDADSNNDNKITARELHTYVEQNVVQQSSGSQTPELQGDKDRVLVQFN